MGIDRESKKLIELPGWKYPAGALNQITDVQGISAGHFTIMDGGIQTGVTALIPHPGNCFRDCLRELE